MHNLLFISGQEIMVILVVVLILFGAKRIPELAKGLGKGMNEFRKATDGIKKEINDASGGLTDSLTDIKKDITRDIKNNLKG